jgi:hypothetical protein
LVVQSQVQIRGKGVFPGFVRLDIFNRVPGYVDEISISNGETENVMRSCLKEFDLDELFDLSNV